jgi:predicted Fe-Mo cluster-binding NifX family protein
VKIAVVTDNENTISAHFGRAAYFVTFTVEDGRAVHCETRPRVVEPVSGGDDDARRQGHGQGHHRGCTVTQIDDCDVVLARGMGSGMYKNLLHADIHPFLTDVTNIDEAVTAYLEGRLEFRPERVGEPCGHRHGESGRAGEGAGHHEHGGRCCGSTL